jgi:hypothetical protein
VGENPNIEPIDDGDDEDLLVPENPPAHEQVSAEDRAIEDATAEWVVTVTPSIADTMRQTWEHLMDENSKQLPDILQRGGLLARYNPTARKVQKYPVGSLTVRMDECMGFFKAGKDGELGAQQKAPKEIAGYLTERTTHPGAPECDLVARMPFLGSDLKIHTERGYHPAEKVWLDPEVDLPPIPDDPHHESVKEAVQFLMDDWLGDFAFKDNASRAHALALALLPFVRPAIAEATPLYLANAPKAGSGKSTLTKTVLAPGIGNISLVNLTRWGPELEYKVTSWLIAGKPVIWFDNQAPDHVVDSALLAALISEPSFSGRPVGTSESPDLPIRCAWVMTGNKLRFTEELARRAVLIEIDEQAAGKVYRHMPLPEWTLENREGIAYALLTLVQHWASGKPVYEGGYIPEGGRLEDRSEERHKPTNMKKTFEQWSWIIGGILEAAGVEGFLENEGLMREKDTVTADVEAFLIALQTAAPDPWTSGEMARMLEVPEATALRDAMPIDLDEKAKRSGVKVALETWLRSSNERWWGDYRIVPTGTRSPYRWRVESQVVTPTA